MEAIKRKGKGKRCVESGRVAGKADAMARINGWIAEAEWGEDTHGALLSLRDAVRAPLPAATVPQPMIEDAVSRFWEQTLR